MDWFVYLLWGFIGGFAVATPIADWAQRMEDANDAISDTPSVGWQCALLKAKARKEYHAWPGHDGGAATAKLHAAAQEMAKELLYVYNHPEYMTTHSEEEMLRALLKKAAVL
jgi:hypothetical protein